MGARNLVLEKGNGADTPMIGNRLRIGSPISRKVQPSHKPDRFRCGKTDRACGLVVGAALRRDRERNFAA
jgi:hypothetical protein